MRVCVLSTQAACLQEMPADVQERFRAPLPQYGPNERDYDADDTQ